MKTRMELHREIISLADDCINSNQIVMARVMLCLSGALHLTYKGNTDDLDELGEIIKDFAIKAKTRIIEAEEPIIKNSKPKIDKSE